MTDIEPVLKRLGLQEYLDVFVAEGFDTWETVLDIQETDLEYLNVKLGHRRRLQRAIAESRGWGTDRPLGSPLQEVITIDSQKPERSSQEPGPNREQPSSASTEQKRKYRRHPKIDENAPEKPPSAYVLFSNKIREEVKSEGLSFTEIARLVGEKWQKLDPTQKDVFESHAASLKDTYNAQLAEYKKTDSYKEYVQYLADFKAKHTNTKRPKLQSEKSSSVSGVSAVSAASQSDSHETTTAFIGHARGGSVGSSSTVSYSGTPAATSSGPLQLVTALTHLGAPILRRSSPPYQSTQERRPPGHFSSQSSVSEESSGTRADHSDSASRAGTMSLITPAVEATPLAMPGQATSRSEFSHITGYSPLSARRPIPTFSPSSTSGMAPSSATSTPGTSASGDWWRERGSEVTRSSYSGNTMTNTAPTTQQSSSMPISQLIMSSQGFDSRNLTSMRALPPLRQVTSASMQTPQHVMGGGSGPSVGNLPYPSPDLGGLRHSSMRDIPPRSEHEPVDVSGGLPERLSGGHQPWTPRSQPDEHR